MLDTIQKLQKVIEDRKENPTEKSYTASLFRDGEDEILKKIGEESVEVILAAKGQGHQRIIEETADLIYHTIVMLVDKGVSWDDILQELSKRSR
ncbi:MAG: phosphoribosyl-ATP diphosphatase [Chloroflexota bacterium]